jgi:hypothetical protein
MRSKKSEMGAPGMTRKRQRRAGDAKVIDAKPKRSVI